MKSRRMIYAVILIWTVLVAALACADSAGWNQERKTAAYLDGCQGGNQVYLIENLGEDSVLYTADPEGNVSSVTRSSSLWRDSVFCQVAWSDCLYGVLKSLSAPAGQTGAVYRIVRFDESGKPEALTPEFLMEGEGTLTGFSAERAGLYLTFVTDVGGQAQACRIDPGELVSLYAESAEETEEKSEEESVQALLPVDIYTCDEGRLVVEARYEAGGFLVRKDDGSGAEDFLAPAQLQDAFRNRSITAGQWLKLRWDELLPYAGLLVVGWIIILLVFTAFRNRNYTFYSIAIVELVLLLITAAGTVQVPRIRETAREEEARRFAYYYLQSVAGEMDEPHQYDFDGEGFYTRDSYYELRNLLSRFAGMDEVSEVFADICLVRSSDGMILVSAGGHNRQTIDSLYGSGTISLFWDMADGNRKVRTTVSIDGQRYQVLGVAASGELYPDYMLAAVTGQEETEGVFAGIPRAYLVYAELIFLAGSLIAAGLLLWQGRELTRLSKAMQQTAAGGQIVKGPVHGKDINLMWNSLLEIGRIISRINYTRYRIYESCYRFAPKNIEKILGKDSITEVSGGDSVLLKGTIAVLSSAAPSDSGQETADRMNSFISQVEKYQEQGEGFFVTGQCDLTTMRLLFLEDSRNTVRTGAAFLHEFYENRELSSLRTCILLHYSQYTYGVAGTEAQSFPFLMSPESALMESCARWLQRMGLCLVITESVRERENPDSVLRCIGYICVEQTQEKIRLYEALDACPYHESRLKQETSDRFAKALELFYSHDFYLARSAFSDVLKENPEDRIAKWYLFTCEKYLNEVKIEGDICGLHWED